MKQTDGFLGFVASVLSDLFHVGLVKRLFGDYISLPLFLLSKVVRHIQVKARGLGLRFVRSLEQNNHPVVLQNLCRSLPE